MGKRGRETVRDNREEGGKRDCDSRESVYDYTVYRIVLM